MAHCILDRAYDRQSPFPLFAVLFFPDSKRYPSTAAITKERHLPADRRSVADWNPQSYVL